MDIITFLGWNSYLTQCWNPFPLIFIDVSTKQLPTKCAVYPTPLAVLKLHTLRKGKNHKYFQLKLMNFWVVIITICIIHTKSTTHACFYSEFCLRIRPLFTEIHLQKTKMCSLCICVSLTYIKEALLCYILPIEVGFFAFNVDRIDWIQPEPRCECEPVLVRPFSNRWQNNSLCAWKQRKQNILFM